MKKLCLNCAEWFNSKGEEKLCSRCSKLGILIRGKGVSSKYSLHMGDKLCKYLFFGIMSLIILAVTYGVIRGLVG